MFSFNYQNIKEYKLSRFLPRLLLLISAFLCFPLLNAQDVPEPEVADTLQYAVPTDSVIIYVDSLLQQTDSAIVDTSLIKKPKKPLLEAEISYSSDDSLIFSVGKQKVFLYDKGVVNYQDIGLSGDYIEFDYSTKIAMAAGAIDSSGKLGTRPEFTQGEEKIQFDTMRYNFETKKAKIKSLLTPQGEGILHSTQTKRLSDGEIHVKKGKYTTCDDPHPHFYLALTKAISIPGKRTVSGPGYLVFEDIPLPLGLPFGFFPNTNKRSSGFIIPEFRDEQRRGFGLENGGWYFALNDFVDITLVGSLYSRGTWGLRTISQYLVKYKYSGQFSAQYFMNRINDDPGSQESRDFKVTWSHSQDPKANPTRTFRASVDFSTSSFEKRQGTNFSNILENQKNSSISFSKRWPGRPFNFAANMTGNQNTRTNKVNLTLPSVNFNMERLYPFRGKDNDGTYNWLQNIQVSYTSKLINRIIDVPDSTLFTESTLKKMKNGFSHSVPISLSNIKIRKFINVTPSVTYDGAVFPYYIRKHLVADTSIFSGRVVEIDTIRKVTYAHSFSTSLSVSVNPKLYGYYTSTRENSKIIAIRHVMTPKASLSFAPDMKGVVPDYFRKVPNTTSATKPVTYSEYSVYEGQIIPSPTVRGRSGNIALGLGNNLEMKVRSKDDTTGNGKKVVLLDNLDFSTNYSPFAEKNKWSAVNMTGRSSLFNKNLQIQFSSGFDPYALDSLGKRTDKFLFNESSKILRLTRAQISMNFRLQSSAGKKKEPGAGATDIEETYEGGPEEVEDIYDDAGGALRSEYVDFDIPWSLSMNFEWNYSKPGLTRVINSSLRFSGDISLTPKWKIGINTSYDLMAKEFSATNLSVYRDLHCWEMRFSLVPFGNYKSYSFTISAKAAILRDLKWDKRRSWNDNF
jgi:hypothetical protein